MPPNQRIFPVKPIQQHRRRGSKPVESTPPPSLPSFRPMEDMKKEFLSKLQRQNASLLTSSVEEEDNDEALGVPDLTILDPDMMGKNQGRHGEYLDNQMINMKINFQSWCI